jgi:hypothetical protein
MFLAPHPAIQFWRSKNKTINFVVNNFVIVFVIVWFKPLDWIFPLLLKRFTSESKFMRLFSQSRQKAKGMK